MDQQNVRLLEVKFRLKVEVGELASGKKLGNLIPIPHAWTRACLACSHHFPDNCCKKSPALNRLGTASLAFRPQSRSAPRNISAPTRLRVTPAFFPLPPPRLFTLPIHSLRRSCWTLGAPLHLSQDLESELHRPQSVLILYTVPSPTSSCLPPSPFVQTVCPRTTTWRSSCVLRSSARLSRSPAGRATMRIGCYLRSDCQSGTQICSPWAWVHSAWSGEPTLSLSYQH